MAIQTTTQLSMSRRAVNDAIGKAAQATGTSFDYLLAAAKVESGLDPKRASATSSARGLFQFIDQTWVAMVKEAGPALGYGRYAQAVAVTPSGRYEVIGPNERRTVLALRDDPAANAALAGAFTKRNAAKLSAQFGREPSEGELYIAHFLGASGAVRLITLAGSNPDAAAAKAFPNAARANRSIFFDAAGNPRTAAGVHDLLVRRYEDARASTNTAEQTGDPITGAAPQRAEGQRFDDVLFEPSTYQRPTPAAVASPMFFGMFERDPARGVSRLTAEL